MFDAWEQQLTAEYIHHPACFIIFPYHFLQPGFNFTLNVWLFDPLKHVDLILRG